MKESSTLFLFGQSEDVEVAETLSIAQLPRELEDVIKALPQGECLLVKAGADPEHVSIGLSNWEAELTNTDAQLIGIRRVHFTHCGMDSGHPLPHPSA
jgi:hypothetical protein